MTDSSNWLGLTDLELEQGLIARGYTTTDLLTGQSTGQMIEGGVEKVRQLDTRLHQPFKHWWDSGTMPDIGAIEGYSLADLMSGAKGGPPMLPIGAFLMMDRLLKEPDRAKTQLKQKFDLLY